MLILAMISALLSAAALWGAWGRSTWCVRYLFGAAAVGAATLSACAIDRRSVEARGGIAAIAAVMLVHAAAVVGPMGVFRWMGTRLVVQGHEARGRPRLLPQFSLAQLLFATTLVALMLGIGPVQRARLAALVADGPEIFALLGVWALASAVLATFACWIILGTDRPYLGLVLVAASVPAVAWAVRWMYLGAIPSVHPPLRFGEAFALQAMLAAVPLLLVRQRGHRLRWAQGGRKQLAPWAALGVFALVGSGWWTLARTWTWGERATLDVCRIERVYAMAFSPDGRTLATGDGIGLAKLWNLSTHKLARVLWEPSAVMELGFSSDGVKLLSKRYLEFEIQTWDLGTGRRENVFRPSWARPYARMSVHPATGVLALDKRKMGMRLFELTRDRAWGPLPCDLENVTAVEVSANFSKAAVLGFAASSPNWLTNRCQMFDLATGRHLWTFETSSEFERLALSCDGRTIATIEGIRSPARSGRVCLWNAASGEKLRTLDHEDVVEPSGIAFSPDGRTLAVACRGPIPLVSSAFNYQTRRGKVVLWDTRTGRTSALYWRKPLEQVAYSPDGKTLAATAGGVVVLWDLR